MAVGLVGAIKRKLAGKAADVGIGLIVSEADRSLKAGEQGDEMKNAWAKLVAFMDGKKTYTGIALLALPKIAAVLAAAAIASGVDPSTAATWTAWGTGGLLTIIGLVHKLVKRLDDLTPDVDA